MDWRRGIPDSITDGGRLLGRRVRSFSMHAAVRVRAGMHRDGEVPGLLSFIVPVYDTERYLDECLTSIRFQEYRNIEIVCVDDGSPDDSVAVVRRHRLRDPRVRLVRRPNGVERGPEHRRRGRARRVPRVRRLRRHGRPCAATARPSSRSTGPAPTSLRCPTSAGGQASPPRHRTGSRAIHAVPRESVDVDEFPEALANAIICSKVFRRKFWDRLGLSFVEGIIYEDQQVSAEAYARADAFDVLTTTLYSWRYRADGSSISQGKREVPNLRAQFAAANESIEVLRTFASHRVVSERLLQLLSNDMPQFTGRLVGASEAYYELLREELRCSSSTSTGRTTWLGSRRSRRCSST